MEGYLSDQATISIEVRAPSLGYYNDPGIRARRRTQNLYGTYPACVVEGCRQASGRMLRLWFASCPGVILSNSQILSLEFKGDGFGTLFECSSFPRVPSSLEMSIVPWW